MCKTAAAMDVIQYHQYLKLLQLSDHILHNNVMEDDRNRIYTAGRRKRRFLPFYELQMHPPPVLRQRTYELFNSIQKDIEKDVIKTATELTQRRGERAIVGYIGAHLALCCEVVDNSTLIPMETKQVIIRQIVDSLRRNLTTEHQDLIQIERVLYNPSSQTAVELKRIQDAYNLKLQNHQAIASEVKKVNHELRRAANMALSTQVMQSWNRNISVDGCEK